MKTKSFFTLTLLLSAGILLFSFKMQETTKKYLTIRAIETSGSLTTPIVIAHEDGKIEEFELGSRSKFHKNTQTLNDILNDFVAKGYKLEFYSSNISGAEIFTSYIMSK